jgi:hypothetical protein
MNIMFRISIAALSFLSMFFVGIIAFRTNQTREALAAPQRAAQQAKQEEQAKLKKQAADYETELYLKSPDGRKMAAQLILSAQFPGWCQWSTAEMIVRPNGDVHARCNGADFAVDTTPRFAMRTIK